MLPWPLFRKLLVVKCFKPEKMPIFYGNEPMVDFIKWNLYDIIVDGTKSFVILCEKHLFYDAFLVAGNLLETCSILSYIKDNKSEQQTQKNLDKYLARTAAGQIISNLQMEKDLSKASAWLSYETLLKLFYPVGDKIIKTSKSESAKEKHEQIMNKLKYQAGLNTDKIQLIEKNYEHPDPAGYVRAFSKRTKNLDNDMFRFMYDKYCAFKHVNFLSLGTMKESLNEDTIMWFIDTVAIIVMYLERYQLEPINDL